MQKKTTYKDVEVCYEITATKSATIVLIHGFCEDSSMWKGISYKLEQDFQLILINLPGYGGSSCTNEILSITWMAEMVNEVLITENITNCIIMGHSLGGYVSIHFAELYSSKLKGIGFINSHIYADDELKKANRNKSISFIEKHTAKLFIRELFNNLFTKEFLKTNSDVVKSLIENAQTTISDKAIIDTLVSMRDRDDKSYVLKNLKIPVLFISGREDETIPVQMSLNQSYLANVTQLHLRDHIAHMSVFEDTDYTLNAMSNFVNFCNK
jgi:pimeloyl-ACP methyl ester carboxylesterase